MNGNAFEGTSTRQTGDASDTCSQVSKRSKKSISKVIGKIRRAMSKDPIEDDDDPVPSGSTYRKYWIEPKERMCGMHSECPGPSVGKEGPDHEVMENLVKGIAANTLSRTARTQWVSNNAFYMKDIALITMIENDYYYYENERERREQEKQEHYDLHRRQVEEQRDNDLAQKADRVAGTIAWVWRPP